MNLINKIGGFPEFPGYGYEDDYVMFRLYLLSAKFVILNDMEVVHVNHEIHKGDRENLLIYFQKLIESGFYWFHSINIFANHCRREDVLEPLKTLHFDSRVERMFKKYKAVPPINLDNSKVKQKEYWKNNYILSKLQFVQLLYRLGNSNNLNDFVSNSSADFDNLANVIMVAIDSGFVELNNHENLTSSFNFQYTNSFSAGVYAEPRLSPKNLLNQFPCDKQSRHRRYNFIKQRYPYVEYLKFAIIGDDDFLSLEFANDYWAWPVIIEKDSRIVKLLKSASDRFEVYSLDVMDNALLKDLPRIQTFITDPPYTLNGALAFILYGLSMLVDNSDAKEFYVILNPTMLGKNLFRLQKILASANIFLIDVINNFSQYDLPNNYIEYKRAEKFSAQQGIGKNVLKKSSSSGMYIFSTIVPDLKKVKQNINYNNIYNHYDN